MAEPTMSGNSWKRRSTARQQDSQSEPPPSHQQRRQRRRKSGAFLTKALVIVAALSWTSVIFAWARSFIVVPPTPTTAAAAAAAPSLPQKRLLSQQQQQQQHTESEELDLYPDDLQHEPFYRTLKSCLSPQKCLRYIPEDDGTKTERIALLAPPGTLGDLFQRFVAEVVRLHKQKNDPRRLELIPTSHVPPYGYGKTHGYTQIIRFVVLPVRLAAADMALAAQPHETTANTEIHLEDIQQATQQLIRWHCRISHVAAHTSVLTMTLENLMDVPWEEEYKVRSFLNLRDENHKLEDHLLLEDHVDEDELMGALDQIVQHANQVYVTILRQQQNSNNNNNKASLLSSLQKGLDAVMDDELMATHNLTDWPCPSLWKANNGLTTISQTNAQLLAPDCKAPHTKCTVPRDRCEERGDPVCKRK